MIVIWQQCNLSSIIQTCADALIPMSLLTASWEVGLGGPRKSHLILFSTALSCGFAVFWLGNFSFLWRRRLDGKASNSSSSAHRIALLDDNVHRALVMVALEDSELALKKKRAGKTPGGMGGLVHRFHHMLSVEQKMAGDLVKSGDFWLCTQTCFFFDQYFTASPQI